MSFIVQAGLPTWSVFPSPDDTPRRPDRKRNPPWFHAPPRLVLAADWADQRAALGTPGGKAAEFPADLG